MPLKDVYASLSTNGSPGTVDLVHRQTGEVVQKLSLIKAEQRHRNFILSTWLKSYRPTARRLGFDDFFNKHEPAIAESRWEDCLVVTDEDGFTVYAWVCGYPGSLYHVYVIPELRNCGVCRELAKASVGPTFDLARPWPKATGGVPRFASGRVNPYLLTVKNG